MCWEEGLGSVLGRGFGSLLWGVLHDKPAQGGQVQLERKAARHSHPVPLWYGFWSF